MKIYSCFVVVLLVTCVGSGCSRWRALTRSDYTELHDPFLGSGSALADNSAGAISPGVVKLGSPGSGAPDHPIAIASYEQRLAELEQKESATPGSRKRQPADDTSPMFPGVNPEATGNSVAARSGGPSLSDFLGRTEAKEVSPPKQTAVVTKTAAREPSVDATEELADFGRYLDEQIAAGRGAGRKQAPSEAVEVVKVAEAVEAAAMDEDFADWAAEWDDESKPRATRATHSVLDTRSRVTQASQSVESQSVEQVAEKSAPTLPAPAVDEDVAAPLIRNTPTVARPSIRNTPKPVNQTVAPVVRAATPRPQPKPATDPTSNPFVAEGNPFAALNAVSDAGADTAQPQPQPVAAPHNTPENAKTLDAMFTNDSGWRPSHLTKP